MHPYFGAFQADTNVRISRHIRFLVLLKCSLFCFFLANFQSGRFPNDCSMMVLLLLLLLHCYTVVVVIFQR